MMSTETEHGLGGIRIRRVFYAVVVTAAVFCFLLLYITVETERVYTRSEGDWTAYVRMQQDAYGMQQGSDYLTQQVRIYTVTEDFACVRLYFEEAEETRRRDRALSAFREGAENEESFLCLEQAMEKSLDLMEREYHAMRLILEASDRMPEDLPERLEAGTQNIPGIAGLSAGLSYVSPRMTAIRAQERALTAVLAERLRGCRGMEVFYAGGDAQTGVLSVRHDRHDCETLAAKLSDSGIAVRAGLHCAPLAHRSAGTLETGTVRLSLSPFTTQREIERAADRILQITQS